MYLPLPQQCPFCCKIFYLIDKSLLNCMLGHLLFMTNKFSSHKSGNFGKNYVYYKKGVELIVRDNNS
jgi:hypothetical protein